MEDKKIDYSCLFSVRVNDDGDGNDDRKVCYFLFVCGEISEDSPQENLQRQTSTYSVFFPIFPALKYSSFLFLSSCP